MENSYNAFLYAMANAADFSAAFSKSVFVLIICMLSILLGIIILGLAVYIVYVFRRKPFLE